MKGIFSHLFAILLATTISACNLPQSSSAVLINDGARTWFDAPLDGSTLKLEPYPVVIHAYDPGGVSEIEFSVNGVMEETLKSSASGNLGLFEYSWDPKKAGNYVLAAHIKNTNSTTSVSVTVGDFTPTPSPTFTSTPTIFTPTVTSSPTPTPSLTPTASPTPIQALTFKANVSANQIYYGGCGTDSVTIQAFVSDLNQATGITLFVNLKDQQSGASTGWDGGEPMNPAGNGWFQRTVGASSIDSYNTYTNSWILYQFVATGSNGAVVGRSPVYSDIGLSGCGAPPSQGITPVRIAPELIITPIRIAPPNLRKIPTATYIPSPK